MLKVQNLEFRLNEYIWDKTVFVCDTASDTDQPQLGDGHRDVVWEFSLLEDESFYDLDREELLWKRLGSIITKKEREISDLNNEVMDLKLCIKQYERWFDTSPLERDDEL